SSSQSRATSKAVARLGIAAPLRAARLLAWRASRNAGSPGELRSGSRPNGLSRQTVCRGLHHHSLDLPVRIKTRSSSACVIVQAVYTYTDLNRMLTLLPNTLRDWPSFCYYFCRIFTVLFFTRPGT